MAKGTPRTCVFCGGTPVTREHAWPQWTLKLLGDKKTGMSWGRGLDADGQLRQLGKQRGPYETKVKVVCEPCNSTWLNKTFEKPAQPIMRPIIQGQARQLEAGEQLVIANWAYKTMLMIEFTASDRRWPFPRDWYTTLRETGRAPNDTFAWIGVNLGDEFVTFYERHPVRIQGGSTSPLPDGYITTMAIGCLIVVLIGKTTLGRLLEVPAPGMWAASDVRQIMPASPTFTWPQGLTASGDGTALRLLAAYFAHDKAGGVAPLPRPNGA